MGYAITQHLTLETEECCNCGVVFAMPDYMMQRLQERGGTFYCPNGHAQHYTKSEVTRLKEKLAEQTRFATQMAAQAYREKQAKNKARAEIKRMQRRAANGVCPCCNRTFKQLARHMKAKHPGYEK